MFCCALLCVHSSFCNHLDGEERAGCYALFVCLMFRDCRVVVAHDATGLSDVCDCGIPDHTHLLFVKSLPSTLCQNIVKEKNLISSCFRSNPNVCMIEKCIVLYVLI